MRPLTRPAPAPRRTASRLAAAVLATTLLLIPGLGSAAPQSAAPDSTVRAGASALPPKIRLSADDRHRLRSLSAEALAKVARARVALHNHKPARALRRLSEVRTLLDLIRAARPTAEVDAMLHYLHAQQELEDNQQALADLLPVYRALDAMAPSRPVHAARERLDAAKQDLEQQSRDDARKELDAMTQSLVIDGVDFPLHAATDTLTKLMRKLNHGDAHIDASDLGPVEKNLLRIVQTAAPPGAAHS